MFSYLKKKTSYHLIKIDVLWLPLIKNVIKHTKKLTPQEMYLAHKETLSLLSQREALYPSSGRPCWILLAPHPEGRMSAYYSWLPKIFLYLSLPTSRAQPLWRVAESCVAPRLEGKTAGVLPATALDNIGESGESVLWVSSRPFG